MKCVDCGKILKRSETNSGRDMCFECYCYHND